MADLLVNLYQLKEWDESRLAEDGIVVKRALIPDKGKILDFVKTYYEGGWVHECEYALMNNPTSCYIAIKDKEVIGFSCYDATSKGTVSGAKDEDDAVVLAKSVICSSLVKAAMFGADANWGIVLCAMGYSGVEFDPTTVTVSFVSKAGEITVCENGAGLVFDEDLAKKILVEDEVTILATLTAGEGTATAWGCDLTYDYVKINGDYRT